MKSRKYEICQKTVDIVYIDPALIEQIIMKRYAVEMDVIFKHNRKVEAIKPRFLLWYLLREKLGWSFNRIGDRYERDHTTILSSIWRCQELGWTKEVKDILFASKDEIISIVEG